VVSNSLVGLFWAQSQMIPWLPPHDPIVVSESGSMKGSTGSLYWKTFWQRWSGGESRWAVATTMQQMYVDEKRRNREWMDSHLRKKLLWQVWGELNPTLLKKLEVEHFISEKTHKYNVLRFLVKILCPTHLWSYSKFDVDDSSWLKRLVPKWLVPKV
jgi:transposase